MTLCRTSTRPLLKLGCMQTSVLLLEEGGGRDFTLQKIVPQQSLQADKVFSNWPEALQRSAQLYAICILTASPAPSSNTGPSTAATYPRVRLHAAHTDLIARAVGVSLKTNRQLRTASILPV